MENITVIIPVYNAENYIPECIESLSKQSYLDFVVLFVNDCSTDSTEEVLLSYKGRTPFEFVIVTLPNNSGPGTARNVGMSFSKTEYTAFLDVDDSISQNYFEALVKVAHSTTSDIVISSAYKRWDNGKTQLHYDLGKISCFSANKEELISMLDVGPWGKIFRTSLWDKNTEFPVDIRAEDLATIPVIYSRASRIAFAPEAIYFYRQTVNSRSRAQGRFYDDIFHSFKVLETRLNDSILVEFYAARTIGYGVVMNALLNKKKASLKHYTEYLKKHFPNGYKNEYIKHLPWQKRLFIRCSYMELFLLQYVMVKITK